MDALLGSRLLVIRQPVADKPHLHIYSACLVRTGAATEQVRRSR
jgi:hypothetical protein